VEDFSFSEDDNGVEENPTIKRQGGLCKKRRVVQPKMFDSGGPRCPVKPLEDVPVIQIRGDEKQWAILPRSH